MTLSKTKKTTKKSKPTAAVDKPARSISYSRTRPFKSESRRGVIHHASVKVIVHCQCEGFKGHKKCWHLKELMYDVGTAMVEVYKR
jgi:hypothetical protein